MNTAFWIALQRDFKDKRNRQISKKIQTHFANEQARRLYFSGENEIRSTSDDVHIMPRMNQMPHHLAYNSNKKKTSHHNKTKKKKRNTPTKQTQKNSNSFSFCTR